MGTQVELQVVRALRGLGAVVLGWVVAAGCLPFGDPIGVDCDAHSTCGVDGPSCAAGEECFAIRGCASPICVPPAQACDESCGNDGCMILESYPAQIACQNRSPAPGRTGGGAGGSPGTGGDVCEELEARRDAELASIQACATDAECGQPLRGTSCGCTRDLVARTDADPGPFFELQEELNALDCGGLVSTCDCPPAEGFACVAGRCSWNYL